MNVLDTEMSKTFVMAAIGQLVRSDLAQWNRTADGELELRLGSGESFLMGDAGITSQKRLFEATSLQSIHLFETAT